MRRKWGFLWILVLGILSRFHAFSQPADTSLSIYSPLPQTTVNTPAYRLPLVSGAHIVAYSGALLSLNTAWYKQYERTGFSTFNDWPEWHQMDKMGHVWSTYQLSRLSGATWKWAGLTDNQSAVLGASSGFAFLTVIELLDAHSAAWGFSWSDMGANTVGSLTYLAQALAWKEQRFTWKFSAHSSKYNDPSLTARSTDLFGTSTAETLLKDYNSQTYWLSGNLKSFFPSSPLPKWLNIAVGYGADGLLGGRSNTAKDELGNFTFYRPDIQRTRSFYLSADIDLTKIPTKRKGIRSLLFALNAIKIPFPTLAYHGNGHWQGYWLYF